MARTNLVFVTDALAADPEEGLELMERTDDISNTVREAVKEAFSGTSGDAGQRAIKAAGRLLKWSAGNFRSE